MSSLLPSWEFTSQLSECQKCNWIVRPSCSLWNPSPHKLRLCFLQIAPHQWLNAAGILSQAHSWETGNFGSRTPLWLCQIFLRLNCSLRCFLCFFPLSCTGQTCMEVCKVYQSFPFYLVFFNKLAYFIPSSCLLLWRPKPAQSPLFLPPSLPCFLFLYYGPTILEVHRIILTGP